VLHLHPKVSIIIPVYNGSNFLREAIDSALAQTYENIEILVVNDGSNDGGKTEKIALSYGDTIRYFAKENGGVASALNLAIKNMKGEYLSWLSHDDLYYSDKIQRQVEVLLNLGGGKFIIYSDFAFLTNSNFIHPPMKMGGVPPKHFRYWLTLADTLHGCSLLIPKAAFEECGVFDETLLATQDYDLWFRFSKNYRFVHVAECLVTSRQHPEQTSNIMSQTSLLEGDQLVMQFIKDLTIEEITAASKTSASDAYKDLADRSRIRGRLRAAAVADQLAIKFATRPKRTISLDKFRLLLKDKAKAVIRRILPHYVLLIIKKMLYKMDLLNRQYKFARIQNENMRLEKAQIIKDILPQILHKFQINSLVDAPCGDCSRMKDIGLKIERYIGCDFGGDLIATNKENFIGDNIEFEALDLLVDTLPKADLIFSHNLLQTLSFEDAYRVIANFKKSGAKYLLATTFKNTKKNTEAPSGKKLPRQVNLQIYPFDFPEPVLSIDPEETTNKALGLWLLKDITLPQEWY
jgi:glycosyltransferase involved in cell wall biosynthesis